LLNGFKRYRCAQKLGIRILPYISLGTDEVMGIIELLRISNSKSLSILEQAKLIDDLKKIHKMCIAEISEKLERSKSWVSMRIGIIDEMSECMREKIFSGKFPVYSYMYTLRQFIRMNFATKDEIDEFVKFVAGKKLSIREIERLAHGYFRGTEEFRAQIKSGNIGWGLSCLKDEAQNSNNCNEFEQGMLKDLEITQKYMQKVTYKSNIPKLGNNSYFAQANILAGGILRQIDIFSKAVRAIYDKSGKA
ncbi:chromosome partitioning protein ParB, partial [Candidatus Desantisbacteria bacterium]|nr:chromosome partitioning protein ParB [Candidatus Desantisbacteria bacterium]